MVEKEEEGFEKVTVWTATGVRAGQARATS